MTRAFPFTLISLRPLIGYLAALLLGTSQIACLVGPNYTAPKPAVAPKYDAAVTASATTRPSEIASSAEPIAEWWRTLRDPQLDSLIQRAMSANLGVQEAASRVRESRANLRGAGAKLLPNVSGSGAYARIDTGRGVSIGGPTGGPINVGVYSAGLDASWELDVFGGQRRNVEAALGDYAASVESQRDVTVSLVAEVARDYLQLRGLQQRLLIAHENLRLQQDTLELTKSLRLSGFNTQFDVSRAQTLVFQTQGQIVPLESEVTQTEHALATLLAGEPGTLIGELSAATGAHSTGPAASTAPTTGPAERIGATTLPTIPPPTPGGAAITGGWLPAMPPLVSVGVPSDLLRRRPDLRRAERQIAAANARVGAAIAGYYPKFSLTGLFGFDSSRYQDMFNSYNRYFVIYPSVSWTLLDFGRVKAQVDAARERYKQATLNYQDTVLTALREVDDTIVAYVREQEHRAALAQAAESAREAMEISRAQYRQGLIDFLQVLDAQRQLLSAQDELVQSEQAIAVDLVALYKALGGGWELDMVRQVISGEDDAPNTRAHRSNP